MKKNRKINNKSKIFTIFKDSINCLIKGSKCQYILSYFIIPFLPILFLILGFLCFAIQVLKMFIHLFKK